MMIRLIISLLNLMCREIGKQIAAKIIEAPIKCFIMHTNFLINLSLNIKQRNHLEKKKHFISIAKDSAKNIAMCSSKPPTKRASL